MGGMEGMGGLDRKSVVVGKSVYIGCRGMNNKKVVTLMASYDMEIYNKIKIRKNERRGFNTFRY